MRERSTRRQPVLEHQRLRHSRPRGLAAADTLCTTAGAPAAGGLPVQAGACYHRQHRRAKRPGAFPWIASPSGGKRSPLPRRPQHWQSGSCPSVPLMCRAHSPCSQAACICSGRTRSAAGTRNAWGVCPLPFRRPSRLPHGIVSPARFPSFCLFSAGSRFSFTLSFPSHTLSAPLPSLSAEESLATFPTCIACGVHAIASIDDTASHTNTKELREPVHL